MPRLRQPRHDGAGVLKQVPFSGAVICFRGRRGCLIKISLHWGLSGFLPVWQAAGKGQLTWLPRRKVPTRANSRSYRCCWKGWSGTPVGDQDAQLRTPRLYAERMPRPRMAQPAENVPPGKRRRPSKRSRRPLGPNSAAVRRCRLKCPTPLQLERPIWPAGRPDTPSMHRPASALGRSPSGVQSGTVRLPAHRLIFGTL